MSVALEVRDLRVFTARKPSAVLVRGISFSLEPGHCLTLLGESGSGKSLLAQAIMGSLPDGLAASGVVQLSTEVTLAGQPQQRRTWWGRRLALLPQEPWLALDPTMPIQGQVTETYRFVGGLARGQADARTEQDFARLGLRDAARKYPFMVSGGMAQRAAFAATRAGGAPVLIVDEPTKGLDADLRDEIVSLLHNMLAAGGAVLAITHDVRVAAALNGQVAVMLDGQIVEHGAASDVLTDPQHAYTRRLLAADPGSWPARPAPNGAGAGILLDAQRLSKRDGNRLLFENFDLALHTGERVAITGPSGSGKTTLGNILMGLIAADSGTLVRSARLGPLDFQKLYQDPGAAFAPGVTLRRSLLDLLHLHHIPWSEVSSMMVQLRLDEELLDRRPQQISGGELQRFALLRVLLLKPALIFADEPTSRLDPITQSETFDLLTETLGKHDSALLLVTHNGDLARNVANRQLRIAPVPIDSGNQAAKS